MISKLQIICVKITKIKFVNRLKSICSITLAQFMSLPLRCRRNNRSIQAAMYDIPHLNLVECTLVDFQEMLLTSSLHLHDQPSVGLGEQSCFLFRVGHVDFVPTRQVDSSNVFPDFVRQSIRPFH